MIHYDSRFAYQFTSFAGSGLPIQIWQYRQGQMVDVTRNYPQQVYDDAYKWWKIYTETRNRPDAGRGVLAAYLADKYLLGEAEDGWNRVEQAYQESDRQSFFIQLRQFLQEMGYASGRSAVSVPSAVADGRVKQLSDQKYEYVVDPNYRFVQMDDRPATFQDLPDGDYRFYDGSPTFKVRGQQFYHSLWLRKLGNIVIGINMEYLDENSCFIGTATQNTIANVTYGYQESGRLPSTSNPWRFSSGNPIDMNTFRRYVNQLDNNQLRTVDYCVESMQNRR